MYPGVEQVKNLPNEIDSRREQYKQQLIESLREADGRHDADGGVEILKKLDAYLSPTEAEAMQDLARRVFKHKLENLRTQFSLAVQDHNWAEAIRLVASGILNPERLITHRLPLSDALDGFAALRRRDAVKVMFELAS